MNTFDRATRRIGDLDNPLYAEERQRDVWNESSAVGFQLLLWGLLVAAAALSVVTGTAAAVPVSIMLGLAALAMVVAVAHAARRSVEIALTARKRGGWRAVLIGGLLGLVVSGLMRDASTGTTWWFVVVAFAVSGTISLVELLLRRRARAAGGDDDAG